MSDTAVLVTLVAGELQLYFASIIQQTNKEAKVTLISGHKLKRNPEHVALRQNRLVYLVGKLDEVVRYKVESILSLLKDQSEKYDFLEAVILNDIALEDADVASQQLASSTSIPSSGSAPPSSATVPATVPASQPQQQLQLPHDDDDDEEQDDYDNKEDEEDFNKAYDYDDDDEEEEVEEENKEVVVEEENNTITSLSDDFTNKANVTPGKSKSAADAKLVTVTPATVDSASSYSSEKKRPSKSNIIRSHVFFPNKVIEGMRNKVIKKAITVIRNHQGYIDLKSLVKQSKLSISFLIHKIRKLNKKAINLVTIGECKITLMKIHDDVTLQRLNYLNLSDIKPVTAEKNV